MDSVTDDGSLVRRVSPFGNLRIDAYVPLPEAYRSLSRPSSAPDAKAFPLCSFQLNLVDADFAHSVSAISLRLPSKTSYRSVASPLRNKTVVLFRSSWFSELCRLISGSLEIVLPFKVPQLLNFLLLPCLSFPLFSFQCAVEGVPENSRIAALFSVPPRQHS